jgi:hypothetical protein
MQALGPRPIAWPPTALSGPLLDRVDSSLAYAEAVIMSSASFSLAAMPRLSHATCNTVQCRLQVVLRCTVPSSRPP